ncbi:HNH endonuclease [Eubacteriales bacterium OttesenSCG-928-A19]|nr:HNH endonuclease [Eubacteriales bacterium OttesenSCG-928-A19]
MPRKPKRPCSYPGCPALTDDRYCEMHQKVVDAHYNRHQRDPETAKRYGATWRRIRANYVAKHPFCEQCWKDGKITPVQEVHHIVPLSHGGTHDPDNLMALCKICHSRITAKEGGRWKRK